MTTEATVTQIGEHASCCLAAAWQDWRARRSWRSGSSVSRSWSVTACPRSARTARVCRRGDTSTSCCPQAYGNWPSCSPGVLEDLREQGAHVFDARALRFNIAGGSLLVEHGDVEFIAASRPLLDEGVARERVRSLSNVRFAAGLRRLRPDDSHALTARALPACGCDPARVRARSRPSRRISSSTRPAAARTRRAGSPPSTTRSRTRNGSTSACTTPRACSAGGRERQATGGDGERRHPAR